MYDNYMTVRVPREDIVEMLVERCKAWGTGEENLDLFEKMYENMVDNGCFDGGELDVMQIVDNDICNNCEIVCEGEEHFTELLEAHDNDNRSIYDIYPHYEYIEAVSDDRKRILIR